jgi:hypothetical protein
MYFDLYSFDMILNLDGGKFEHSMKMKLSDFIMIFSY